MLSKYISQDFFKDRLVSVLAGSVLVATIVGVVQVVLNVQSFTFDIPVRYSEYGIDSYKLGDWYSLYEFAFFIALSSIFALFVALRLHNINRPLTLSVLIFQHIIIIFFFFVSTAILNTSPVTS